MRYAFSIRGHKFLLDLRQSDQRLYVGRYEPGDWHESEVADQFETQCADATCILDIGAHIGWYTCFAGAVSPGARIVAFEPDSGNARAARANVALNRLYGATVVEAAVSEKHGEGVWLGEGKSSLEYSLRSGRDSHSLLVRSVSVDGWCRDADCRPDVIKIDVEGAEERVFQGMQGILGSVRPSVLVEVHSQLAETNCLQCLDSRGYTPVVIRLGPTADEHWSNKIIVAPRS